MTQRSSPPMTDLDQVAACGNKCGRPRLELDVEAIAADYQAGMSLAECAARHGCTIDTIWRRLIEAGVERRPPSQGNHPPKHDYGPAFAAYAAGATLREAATLVDRSPTTLLGVMKNRGIPRRPSGPPLKDYPEAVALYLTGISAHDVGARLGLSGSTVRNALDRSGIAPRPRYQKSPAKQRERAARLMEAAKGKGSPAQKARHTLRKLGLIEAGEPRRLGVRR
jgi:hypothetical protein